MSSEDIDPLISAALSLPKHRTLEAVIEDIKRSYVKKGDPIPEQFHLLWLYLVATKVSAEEGEVGSLAATMYKAGLESGRLSVTGKNAKNVKALIAKNSSMRVVREMIVELIPMAGAEWAEDNCREIRLPEMGSVIGARIRQHLLDMARAKARTSGVQTTLMNALVKQAELSDAWFKNRIKEADSSGSLVIPRYAKERGIRGKDAAARFGKRNRKLDTIVAKFNSELEQFQEFASGLPKK